MENRPKLEPDYIGNSISPETKIVFTIKMFIITISTILGIFVGFYKLAIAPKFEEQSKNIESINNKIFEISSGIGIINGNIEGINNRFRDLNQIRENHDDSGGSFGN